MERSKAKIVRARMLGTVSEVSFTSRSLRCYGFGVVLTFHGRCECVRDGASPLGPSSTLGLALPSPSNTQPQHFYCHSLSLLSFQGDVILPPGARVLLPTFPYLSAWDSSFFLLPLSFPPPLHS